MAGEASVLGGTDCRYPALASPPLILAFAILVCVALLSLPLSLPLGPMYWDLAVYVDGAHRVSSGQVPSVDFFAPVGPIGYWLMAAGTALFPSAQPLLLVQWSLLALTGPLMALVLWDIDRHSRSIALALLFPFLAFQLMPMNVEQFSIFPSTDGYGIYNRHVVELLYVLTAALVFSRSQRVLLVTIAGACLSLFLLKVTGFLTAGLLCVLAFACGRVRLGTALGAALVFAGVLAVLQATISLPSAYIGDIAALVAMNESSLLPRFLQAMSIHFGTFGSASLLVAALLLIDRTQILRDLRLAARPTMARVHSLLDRPVVWLGIGLAGGLFFETQNTGGQAFIFLWPILLAVLIDARRLAGGPHILVAVLVAATALPPLVNTLHRFARAMVGQANYVVLDHEHLGTLGSVSQRSEAMERARATLEVAAAHPDTFQAFADRRMLPGWLLYSDLDFQLGWLMTTDEAVGAILAFEAANGVRFETIMSLNFSNPFPALLNRSSTRRIAIGADPFRAVPTPDAETIAAVAQTDLVLYPTCPITVANERLYETYEAGLRNHERVVLSPCWVGYVRR